MKRILSFVFLCFLCFQVSAHADFFNDDPGSYLYKDYWNYQTNGASVSLVDNNNRLEGSASSPSQLSGAEFNSAFTVNWQNDFSCQVDFYSSYNTDNTKAGTIGIGFANTSNDGLGFSAVKGGGANSFLAAGNHSTLPGEFVSANVGDPIWGDFKGTLFVDYTVSNKTFNFYAQQDFYGTLNTITLDAFQITDEMASEEYALSLGLMADPNIIIGEGEAYLENFKITNGTPTLPITSPEPLSAALFLIGGAGLVIGRKKRRK